ncbi:MAG: MBL fold metallo-hydrolase [Actinobacteria bacterium]|nr:MAG: MBL fold metallo-hydrolase [Actinomycetota bacterium]
MGGSATSRRGRDRRGAHRDASRVREGRRNVIVQRVVGPLASSYLIRRGNAVVLVDAGYVGHGGLVRLALRSHGLGVDAVRCAIVTHGHADHFGGLAELRARAEFPVLAHPEHAPAVEDGLQLVSPGISLWGRTYGHIARASLPWLSLPRGGAVTPTEDGGRLDEYGLPATVLHTPGHSDGCVSVLLDNGSAFVGDLIQGPRMPGMSVGLPAMAIDADAAVTSWHRLLDLGATRFYPAHGLAFSANALRVATERPRPT